VQGCGISNRNIAFSMNERHLEDGIIHPWLEGDYTNSEKGTRRIWGKSRKAYMLVNTTGESIILGHPKPVAPALAGRAVPVPIRNPAAPGIVVNTGPSSKHTPRTISCLPGTSIRWCSKIAIIPAIPYPFPYVAAHII
jgi:hypothetical protein